MPLEFFEQLFSFRGGFRAWVIFDDSIQSIPRLSLL
jgi:hypothetical protein